MARQKKEEMLETFANHFIGIKKNERTILIFLYI